MTVLRWLWASALSLLLFLVGAALAVFGLILAIVAVVRVVEELRPSVMIASLVLSVGGVALLLGAVRLITRFRPWAVMRLSGRDVPAVPALLAAMWGASEAGVYSSFGGGDGGGGNGGAGC